MREHGYYEILRKENLFIDFNIDKMVNISEIERFPGVILAKDTNCQEFIVFASTGFIKYDMLKKGFHQDVSLSEDILECFDNEDEACRLYESILAIFRQIPKFKPSKIIRDHCHMIPPRWITGIPDFFDAKKSHIIYSFKEGVELGYCLYIYNCSDYTLLSINGLINITVDSRRLYLFVLEELTNYFRLLSEVNIISSSNIKLSNCPYPFVFSAFKDLHKKESCNYFSYNEQKGILNIRLGNDKTSVSIEIRPATRNEHYWDYDIHCLMTLPYADWEMYNYKPNFGPCWSEIRWRKTLMNIFERIDTIFC